jgi:taurine dioxygenase
VTGELSIYANLGFTRRIDDVSDEESRELMAILCRMAERPEYQCRMRWRDAGDVCIYDNRITNHYAVADYGDVGPRALHHIALLGEPTMDAWGKVVG